MRSLILLSIASACAGLMLATSVVAAPDLRVYAPISWEGNGKSVQTPSRFNVMYQAQSATLTKVAWRGWGTRIATGHGLSYYNSGASGEKVTVYMGGGLTTCDNGKRYYKILAAVGNVTSNFPNQPILFSAMLGAKASPSKALIWHLNCTGGPFATTGYWSRLR